MCLKIWRYHVAAICDAAAAAVAVAAVCQPTSAPCVEPRAELIALPQLSCAGRKNFGVCVFLHVCLSLHWCIFHCSQFPRLSHHGMLKGLNLFQSLPTGGSGFIGLLSGFGEWKNSCSLFSGTVMHPGFVWDFVIQASGCYYSSRRRHSRQLSICLWGFKSKICGSLHWD